MPTKRTAPTPVTQPATAVPTLPTSTDLAVVREETIRTTGTVTLTQQATELVVTSPESRLVAANFLTRISAARKMIVEKFDPIVKPLRTALDAVYEMRRELDEPLAGAETAIKSRMSDWDASERRRVEAEKRALIIEQQRLQREAQAKIDAEVRARRAAEYAEQQAREAKTIAERKRAEAEAEVARQAAHTAELERQLADHQAVAAASVPIPVAPKATGGYGSRVTYSWVVADFEALYKGVQEGIVPETVLKVDEEAMDAYWSADKEMVAKWPGIGVAEKTGVVAARGRR